MVFHIERTVAAQLILPTHMFFAENIPPTLASTITNIALNKIGRLMDYFLLSFSHDFMAIAVCPMCPKMHIADR